MNRIEDGAEVAARATELAEFAAENPLAQGCFMRQLDSGFQEALGGGEWQWGDVRRKLPAELTKLVQEGTPQAVCQAAQIIRSLEEAVRLYRGETTVADYVRALNRTEPGSVLEAVDGTITVDWEMGILAEAVVLLTDGRSVPVIDNKIIEHIAGLKIFGCSFAKNIFGRLAAIVQVADPRESATGEGRHLPVIGGVLQTKFEGADILDAQLLHYDDNSRTLTLRLRVAEGDLEVNLQG